MSNEFIKANFSISDLAKAEIELRRQYWDKNAASKAKIPAVAWSLHQFNDGRSASSVLVTFYDESNYLEVLPYVQQVSGIGIIFFTTPEYAPKFEGKVLDFSSERDFFLR